MRKTALVGSVSNCYLLVNVCSVNEMRTRTFATGALVSYIQECPFKH